MQHRRTNRVATDRLPRIPGSDQTRRIDCPLLGSVDGPGSQHSSTSGDNYCHESRFPVPIGTIHQENYCLTANFESCQIFRKRSEVADPDPVAVASTPVAAIAVPSAVKAVQPADQAMTDLPDSSPVLITSALSSDESEFSSANLFDWAIKKEPNFPIIDPNDNVVFTHHRKRQVNSRKLLVISTVLFGLFLFGWWEWLNFLVGSGNNPQAMNRSSDLPTLAPTADVSMLGLVSRDTIEGESTDGSSVGAELTEGRALPLIETEEQDNQNAYFESIALTATALFVQSTPASCSPPAWWVQYIVQAEDTLESVALSRGITPQEIVQANCLSSDVLKDIALVYLPPLGVITVLPEVETPTPFATITSTSPPAPVPTLPQFFVSTPTVLPVIIFPTPQSSIIIMTNAPPPTSPSPTSPPPVAPINLPPLLPSPTSPLPATRIDLPEQPPPTATPPSPPSEATEEPPP
jgi:LysM repeat protein